MQVAASPAAAPGGPNDVLNVSVSDRVVGGLVSVWDRGTRSMVGTPALVWDEPLRWEEVAGIALRPGHPDEVAVAARNRPVLLWNVVERRVVARFPVEAPAPSVVFTPDGSRLAVRTADGSFEPWDVDDVRRTSAPLFTPDTPFIVGFTSDGYFATSDLEDTLKLWDLDRGVLSGTIALAPGQKPVPDRGSDVLRLADSSHMPTSMPLVARTWADELCSALGDYTAAQVAALPAGMQDRRPCP